MTITALRTPPTLSGSAVGGVSAGIRRKMRSSPACGRVLPSTASPNSELVTILDRTESQCAYIPGDAKGSETMMCGAPVERRSLCAFHFAACWVSTPQRRPK